MYVVLITNKTLSHIQYVISFVNKVLSGMFNVTSIIYILHPCTLQYSTVPGTRTCILCMRILHSPPRSMYVTFHMNWTFETDMTPSPEPGMRVMWYFLFGKKRFENREKNPKQETCESRKLEISLLPSIRFNESDINCVRYCAHLEAYSAIGIDSHDTIGSIVWILTILC
jgi:hypothetical protein